MQSYQIKDFNITLNKQGSGRYTKVSYPIRFGTYSIIETGDYIYHFNLNGEVRFIQSKDVDWAKDEWLKRTEGNDLVYYTPGIYTGLHSYIGEYYLPCFSYKSNSIFAFDPYVNANVDRAVKSIDKLSQKASQYLEDDMPFNIRKFLKLIAHNNLENLKRKSDRFHKISGGQSTVLPPDSRHVDYDVIPITIADGCLYKCGFCMVKTKHPFKERSEKNIMNQVTQLKDFYSDIMGNYNSIFLGQHDALGAGQDLIEFSAKKSYEVFGFKNSNMNGAYMFIFGSIGSFLNAGVGLFKALNKIPYYTYINIGLESADSETLKILNKPVTVEDVKNAYRKMLEINKKYDRIEITANFILSNDLPEGHYPSIINLLTTDQKKFYSKGGIYLSPLYKSKDNIELKKKFIEIKNRVRIPAFIYLIQRL